MRNSRQGTGLGCGTFLGCIDVLVHSVVPPLKKGFSIAQYHPLHNLNIAVFLRERLGSCCFLCLVPLKTCGGKVSKGLATLMNGDIFPPLGGRNPLIKEICVTKGQLVFYVNSPLRVWEGAEET